MTECTNDYALEVMKAQNWTAEDLVYLGSSFSESNVKLQMYLAYLKEKKLIDGWKQVEVNFANGADLADDGKGGLSWGLDNPNWKKFTGGAEGANGRIPTMFIGGKLYWDSAPILKMLFEKYEGSTASEEVKTAFNELFELSKTHEGNYYDLIKHFGWCAMNGAKENYKACNNLTDEQKKEKMKSFSALLAAVEERAKGGKTYLVGDSFSVVDMLVLHWPASAYQVVSYPVEAKYPAAWAWYKKMCAKPPTGSNEYLNGQFAFFGKVIWVLNMSRMFGGSHWIGNAKYH